MVTLKTLIRALRMESEAERIKCLSEDIGEIKWCGTCKEVNPRTSISLWDHSEKCSCGTKVSILRLEDFI